jgi:hypothetical protein
MNKNNFYTLITGASEGLGKALAIEGARRNMNLILVALPGSGLHSLANLIKRNYPVEVISIEKDLCREESCWELYQDISVMNLQVNILINNAGLGSTVLFENGSIHLYEKQIRLNVMATTLLTRLFLGMLKQNSPSYILNVGSMASFFCLPRKNVYGATKSFIYSFSKSLHSELQNQNIHVGILCPGGMNTNLLVTLMNKTGNIFSRMSILNPEKVAAVAMKGLLMRKKVIIPGWVNNCFLLLNFILPGFIKNRLMQISMNKLQPQNRFHEYIHNRNVISPAAAMR